MAKIRTGFVSNSSSSSFIIGIAKVTNLALAEKSIKDAPYSFDIVEVQDERDLVVESFNGDEVSLTWDDVLSGDHVLLIDHCGNEGDQYFIMDDDSDFNYDIDYEDCNEGVRNIIDNLMGIEKLSISYGAGRNG